MAESNTPSARIKSRPPSPIQIARRTFARGETIRLLVGSQLKAGHRHKALGQVWSLLDPLITLAVYFLIFGMGFRQAGDHPSEFVIYLFVAIVVWRFFAESVSQATGCLRSNRGLIVTANFPKAVIPVSICFARLYDMCWSLIAIFAVVELTGHSLSWEVLWLPLIVFVQLMFTLGACFFVAYLGLFFADSSNIVVALLRLWVMLSPMFYFYRSEHGRKGIISAHMLDYYMLNPVVGWLDAYRAVLIWAEPPSWRGLGYVAAVGAVVLVAGFSLFSRGEGRFAKFV
jgi:ABC-type polysaccharide/polyol phosphate export permease